MGAPIGNKNAVPRNKKLFGSALDRAIAQDEGRRLREAAEALLDAASNGEPWAINALADRLDGKPAQSIVGDSDSPLEVLHRIERVIIPAK